MLNITQIIKILENTYSTHIMEYNYTGKPYKALVSCLLSLRTRDEVTFPIAEKLFQKADTPQKILELPYEDLCAVIKSINYYKTKAKNIRIISQTLLEKYSGNVPETMEELLELKGVGRKTANIVLAVGFKKPAIAVDTHVHRISNRLGYVNTKTPEQTEFELREKVPQQLWRKVNQLFVQHGRNICRPVRPLCQFCPVPAKACPTGQHPPGT